MYSEAHTDFDYPEDEPEDDSDLEQKIIEAASILSPLVAWITDGYDLSSCGTRAIFLASKIKAGERSQSAIARRFGLSRAAVSKCKLSFEERFYNCRLSEMRAWSPSVQLKKREKLNRNQLWLNDDFKKLDNKKWETRKQQK